MIPREPEIALKLLYTWCRAGDHQRCPGTMGASVCSCDCHLDTKAEAA